MKVYVVNGRRSRGVLDTYAASEQFKKLASTEKNAEISSLFLNLIIRPSSPSPSLFLSSTLSLLPLTLSLPFPLLSSLLLFLPPLISFTPLHTFLSLPSSDTFFSFSLVVLQSLFYSSISRS